MPEDTAPTDEPDEEASTAGVVEVEDFGAGSTVHVVESDQADKPTTKPTKSTPVPPGFEPVDHVVEQGNVVDPADPPVLDHVVEVTNVVDDKDPPAPEHIPEN